jgi:hypothetical protein
MNVIKRFVGLCGEVLREIFDEAAYSRFLSRAGLGSSTEAYAAFRHEFEEAKTRRPKCC